MVVVVAAKSQSSCTDGAPPMAAKRSVAPRFLVAAVDDAAGGDGTRNAEAFLMIDK